MSTSPPLTIPAVAHLPLAGIGILAFVTFSSTALKSSPPLLEKAPGTFSQIMKVGYCPFVANLISLIILIACMNNPERLPLSPFLFPAMLKSWQGLPKVIISTGCISSPFSSVTLPTCITSLKRYLVMSIQFGSTSAAHNGLMVHPVSIPLGMPAA